MPGSVAFITDYLDIGPVLASTFVTGALLTVLVGIVSTEVAVWLVGT